MSIYKRGNIWWYRFIVNNKVYQGSTKEKNERKALNIEKEIKKNLKSGANCKDITKRIEKQLINNNITLNNAWNEYAKIAIFSSNKNMQQRRNYITDFLIYCIEQHNLKYLHEIKINHAKEYHVYLSNNGKYKKKISFATPGGNVYNYTSSAEKLSLVTIKNYIMYLNKFFNEMKEIHAVNNNPIEKIRIKGHTRSHVHREAFTISELEAITGYIKKDNILEPLIIIGISTGLRKKDICLLESKNVDIQNRIITYYATAKTNEPVYIPIVPMLHDYICTIDITNKYLFPVLAEQYKNNPTWITRKFKKMLADLNISGNLEKENRSRKSSTKDIHSLRHTFAYIAAINQVPFTIVQSILGHMTADLTKMYMEHSTMEAKSEALNRLPNFLRSNENKEDEIIAKITSLLNKANKEKLESILSLLGS